MSIDLQQQNAELAVRVEQLEAALRHCRNTLHGLGYRGATQEIDLILAAPSPAVVRLNAAARELDIVDIIKKVEALLHRGRAMSDLDYDKGFCYAISSVLSVLHELAEVQK